MVSKLVRQSSMNSLNKFPYEVNINKISRRDGHDEYLPPQFWINFSDCMSSQVNWDEIFRNYNPHRMPVMEQMRIYLQGMGADITLVGGKFVLLFVSEEDFLAFKMKWL